MLSLSLTLRRVLMVVLVACTVLARAEETIVTQYEEDFSLFCNPEQGFYEYKDLNRLTEDIGQLRNRDAHSSGAASIWCLTGRP